jgi:hypothetical protein
MAYETISIPDKLLKQFFIMVNEINVKFHGKSEESTL